MANKLEHRYTANIGTDGSRLTCACGHIELIEADFNAALTRMNEHIRDSYTADEWDKQMRGTKLTIVDSTSGAVSLSDGPKS